MDTTNSARPGSSVPPPGRQGVLVIALDGATWTLLDGWIAAGHLPNLARLCAQGTSGSLESTVPPITPVAWLTFATSKNPARHGVFDFFRPLRTSYTELVPATGDLNHEPTLWGTLSQRGYRIGMINVPMTYPPEPVNGFLIPGIPTPRCADPGYPPGFLDGLRNRGWDLTRDAAVPQDSYSATLAYLHDLVETRTEATCHLLGQEAWDLFIVHFLETDQVQHTFWRFLDREDSPFHDAILRVYQHVDEGIGRIEDAAGERIVLVMSDHGMGSTQYVINLNNWLLQAGYMRWRDRPATHLRRIGYRMGLSPASIYSLLPASLLSRLTLGELRTGLAQVTTEHVGRQTTWTKRLVQTLSRLLFLGFDDVDWSRSSAYSTGTTQAGLIWLNVAGREPQGSISPGSSYLRLRDEIAERLMDFRDPWTGRLLVQRVYRREELYAGPHLQEAPDLIATYHHGEYDHRKGTVFLSTRPIEPIHAANASHRLDGILLLSAAGTVKSGARISDARIQDIVPTVLHLLGEAVPAEFEGTVLTQALTDAYVATHPVRISGEMLSPPASGDAYSADDLQTVLEKLRDLGYIS
jgi:predicted AlkP superfamily phosphohydrolase/phosphomutase